MNEPDGVTFQANARRAGSKYFENLKDDAITFLKNYILVDEIKVKILFEGDTYANTVASLYKDQSLVKGTEEENGRFICRDNCKDKSDIIIINCNKIFDNYKLPDTNTKEAEIKAKLTSIIIHELVHAFDYLDKEIFYLKYNIPIDDKKENIQHIALKTFFYHRSEMRAKYYQEQYYMETLKDTINYYEHINGGIEKIKNEILKETNEQELTKQWYNIAHAWGLLLYWRNYHDISKGEEYLNSLIGVEESKYLPRIFYMDKFYSFCNSNILDK